MMSRARLLLVAIVAGVCVLAPVRAQAQDQARAARAHSLIMEMEFAEAAKVLQGAPEDDSALALERGRLLLYTTDYDKAVELLDRPDVARSQEGMRLGSLARDCARSMAGALVVPDPEHGVVVRMQDDHDAALAPMLGEVAQRARQALARDLGVELPVPIRIELVRDQFALSAMTGLPEQSARTTGTVAVANWGRVAILTPRAPPDGYPWMDTLAHELTHLAIARGTRDRAPLWFQEGVAKHEETRWRDPDPSDEIPSPDSVAAVGFDLGLGRNFDDFGPSIAMLPSADQAMIAFAEVQSFIEFWVREAGPTAVPKALEAMKNGSDVADAIRTASSKDMANWNELWRKHIASASRQLPPELGLGSGAVRPEHAKAGRSLRLGTLLLDRGHPQAAASMLQQAQTIVPSELIVRARLAKAWLALDREPDAWRELESVGPTLSPNAEAFALRGSLQRQRGDLAQAAISFSKALSMDPWEPAVACEMLQAPQLPQDRIRAALCDAARKWPQ